MKDRGERKIKGQIRMEKEGRRMEEQERGKMEIEGARRIEEEYK